MLPTSDVYQYRLFCGERYLQTIPFYKIVRHQFCYVLLFFIGWFVWSCALMGHIMAHGTTNNIGSWGVTLLMSPHRWTRCALS